MTAHSVPLHCPYCAGEELHPHGDVHGAWECRECLRAFGVKFLGLLTPTTYGSTSGVDSHQSSTHQSRSSS